MAKTKIGVLSNMVNKPVKVFTTFASVDQIEQANGKLPSTSFIVASEVDANNEDTGVFNAFVTDADGYAAQISYINKVCYTSYSTNALYVNKVNNVNSLEARTMSSTQYGVARLASASGLQNDNNGLRVNIDTSSSGSLTIANGNQLSLKNSYVNNLIDTKLQSTNNYKTIFEANCTYVANVEGLPSINPSDIYDQYIEVLYGTYIAQEENEYSYDWIKCLGAYYISYIAHPTYTYDILQMTHTKQDGAIIPTLCYTDNITITNMTNESATQAFVYSYSQKPIYKYKFMRMKENADGTYPENPEYIYTYYDNKKNGTLYSNDKEDIYRNELLKRLITFDTESIYTLVNYENSTYTYTYGFTSELNDKILLPQNSSLYSLISNSNQFNLTSYYNRSVLSVNIDKLSLPTASSTKKGMVSVNTLRGLTVNTSGQLNINVANDTTYGTVKIDNDTIKVNENGQLYTTQLTNVEALSQLDAETIDTLVKVSNKIYSYNYVSTRYLISNTNNDKNIIYIDGIVLDEASQQFINNKYNNSMLDYLNAKLSLFNLSSMRLYMDGTAFDIPKSISQLNDLTINSTGSGYAIAVKSNSNYYSSSNKIDFLKIDEKKFSIQFTASNLLVTTALWGNLTIYNNTPIKGSSLLDVLYAIVNEKTRNDINQNDNIYLEPFNSSSLNSTIYIKIGDIYNGTANKPISSLAAKIDIPIRVTNDTTPLSLVNDINSNTVINYLNESKCTIVSYDFTNNSEYIEGDTIFNNHKGMYITLNLEIQKPAVSSSTKLIFGSKKNDNTYSLIHVMLINENNNYTGEITPICEYPIS